MRVVTSLYEGAKNRGWIWVLGGISCDSRCSLNGSVLLPLLLAIVVDVVTMSPREGLMNEILHAHNLIFRSKTMENLQEKFRKWKEAFEKVDFGKPKTIISRSEGEIPNSKNDLCSVCWEKGNGLLIVVYKIREFDSWVTSSIAKEIVPIRCKKVKNKFKGRVEPIEKLCDEVQSVNGFCYLGNRLNTGGRCEAAVTARTWLGEIQRMSRTVTWKKVFDEDERKD